MQLSFPAKRYPVPVSKDLESRKQMVLHKVGETLLMLYLATSKETRQINPSCKPDRISENLLLILVSLDGRHCDTVQIPLSRLSDSPATLILVSFQHTDLLQSLHYLPVNAAAGINVV